VECDVDQTLSLRPDSRWRFPTSSSSPPPLWHSQSTVPLNFQFYDSTPNTSIVQYEAHNHPRSCCDCTRRRDHQQRRTSLPIAPPCFMLEHVPAYVWPLTISQHLKTEVVTAVDCKRPTIAGDKIHVHCTSSSALPPQQSQGALSPTSTPTGCCSHEPILTTPRPRYPRIRRL
jgi:hypothetical protein